jgi:beta-lactamase family protein
VFEAVRARREELGVPGVVVGVLQDGEERHEAFGVTSVENPLPVTPETRFQIGSTSKTFTATAVLYLVAEGAGAGGGVRAEGSAAGAEYEGLGGDEGDFSSWDEAGTDSGRERVDECARFPCRLRNRPRHPCRVTTASRRA